METRTLIAVILSIAVLIIFQFFYQPSESTYFKPQPDMSNRTSENIDNVGRESSDFTSKDISPKVPEIKQVPLVHIKNDYLDIGFNKNTGFINEIKIVNYKNKINKPVIFKTPYKDYISHNNFGHPSEPKIKKNQSSTEIEFVYDSSSVVTSRTYMLKNNSFVLEIKDRITNKADKTIHFDYLVSVGPGLGDGFDVSRYIFSGPLIYDGKKIYKKKENKVDDDIVISNSQWFGYTSKYFLLAVIDSSFKKTTISKYEKSAIVNAANKFIINPKGHIDHNLKIYVGPKEYNLLKSFGSHLEKSIDYGIFFFLAIPFLQILIFFNNIFHNYGVAIILLTAIIKFVTLPLNSISMKSMKKMQKIQPEVLKIREKYKGDPQKMNAAVMELYRKNKVNPVSGCLPMLIQIPIFIALYKMLLVSIELKSSPFIWWLTDLSEKDPYYITPILMGISMFIQQKMTPSTADPTQQKMFMLMPIIFTFLFINFPSGLVIYWLVNNILTITHQYYLNKKLA
jgi:YidC/Oxa1 family membrane protein insertase